MSNDTRDEIFDMEMRRVDLLWGSRALAGHSPGESLILRARNIVYEGLYQRMYLAAYHAAVAKESRDEQ